MSTEFYCKHRKKVMSHEDCFSCYHESDKHDPRANSTGKAICYKFNSIEAPEFNKMLQKYNNEPFFYAITNQLRMLIKNYQEEFLEDAWLMAKSSGTFDHNEQNRAGEGP